MAWAGRLKNPQGLKTRKGIVGGFKEELDQNDIDFMNKEINLYLLEFYKRGSCKSDKLSEFFWIFLM